MGLHVKFDQVAQKVDECTSEIASQEQSAKTTVDTAMGESEASGDLARCDVIGLAAGGALLCMGAVIAPIAPATSLCTIGGGGVLLGGIMVYWGAKRLAEWTLANASMNLKCMTDINGMLTSQLQVLVGIHTDLSRFSHSTTRMLELVRGYKEKKTQQVLMDGEIMKLKKNFIASQSYCKTCKEQEEAARRKTAKRLGIES